MTISREHHHGLLLCWKIRNGLKKKIDPKRIKIYTDWFWQTYLIQHFEIEEKYIFSVLDNKHELVLKALAEHRRLRRLFESKDDYLKKLYLIEEELESHIRFEERILFEEIQNKATTKQIEQIEKYHSDDHFTDNLNDPFWE